MAETVVEEAELSEILHNLGGDGVVQFNGGGSRTEAVQSGRLLLGTGSFSTPDRKVEWSLLS